MKSHGGPNLARGPEFDTYDVEDSRSSMKRMNRTGEITEP